MSQKNNQLKALANLAKQRLLNKDYTEKTVDTFVQNKVSTYFLENAKALKKLSAKIEFVSIEQNEDEHFINRVILSIQNDELKCLGELTDKEYYNTLSLGEKQLYILKLSEKINKIKEEYFNKQQNINKFSA